MKKYILASALGSAMMLGIPAFAVTSPYVFNTTTCGGSQPSCTVNNDNIGPYTAGSTGSLGTGTGVTATAVGVYYSIGSASAFTNGTLHTGDLGIYQGAGLGACEDTGADCTSPSHQIDNGKNGFTTDDYEFVLIKFSSAVDLTSLQLGNFGGGSSTDPFNITYYTSTSTAASLALAGTTLGVGNSFSAAQSQSSQSSCGGTNGTCTDNMTGSATDNVTYLLIGASIADNGTDYFKIQDINAGLSNNQVGGAPEPATFGMIGLALAGLGIYGRKRKSRNS